MVTPEPTTSVKYIYCKQLKWSGSRQLPACLTDLHGIITYAPLSAASHDPHATIHAGKQEPYHHVGTNV
jgi:hypothetical protein